MCAKTVELSQRVNKTNMNCTDVTVARPVNTLCVMTTKTTVDMNS